MFVRGFPFVFPRRTTHSAKYQSPTQLRNKRKHESRFPSPANYVGLTCPGPEARRKKHTHTSSTIIKTTTTNVALEAQVYVDRVLRCRFFIRQKDVDLPASDVDGVSYDRFTEGSTKIQINPATDPKQQKY